LCLLTLGVWCSGAWAKDQAAALVLDAKSGQTLIATHADERRHPASLTKLMTLYLLFLELDARKLKLNDGLSVSKTAAQQPPSNVALSPGDKLSVEQAILALTVKSANDVAVVIAENIAGSQSKFAKRMNEQAHALGLRSSAFRNASGLYQQRQLTTARDMARLSRTLLRRFPQYYHYFSVPYFALHGRGYGNHNTFITQYAGADGLKTGYIGASGYNLAASAERDGHRLVGVVLGAASPIDRNRRMAELLDQGFRKLGVRTTSPTARRADSRRKPVRFDPIPPSTAETWSLDLGVFPNVAGASGAGIELRRSWEVLADTSIAVEPLKRNGRMLYGARLDGLEKAKAESTCRELQAQDVTCTVSGPYPP
jgi:D-alanyl-D-alanine carboxypeptidase